MIIAGIIDKMIIVAPIARWDGCPHVHVPRFEVAVKHVVDVRKDHIPRYREREGHSLREREATGSVEREAAVMSALMRPKSMVAAPQDHQGTVRSLKGTVNLPCWSLRREPC